MKMTEIKIQNGCWEKTLDKKCVHEKELKKPNHCAKTVLQCRILKARKSDVNGLEA